MVSCALLARLRVAGLERTGCTTSEYGKGVREMASRDLDALADTGTASEEVLPETAVDLEDGMSAGSITPSSGVLVCMEPRLVVARGC